MPLPVSHSLAAAAIYSVADADGGGRGWRRLLLAVVLANAPDLDLIPGVILGDPNRFHHGASHSFVTAIAIGLALSGLLGLAGWHWPLARISATGAETKAGNPQRESRLADKWRDSRLAARWPGLVRTALMVAALWGSHVVLDLLTHDPHPPVGFAALWPLSSARFEPLPVFASGDKIVGPASPLQFAASLLSPHNFRAAVTEMLWLGPLVVIAQWWRRRRRRSCARC